MTKKYGVFTRNRLKLALAIIAILAVVYFFRPWLHGFAMALYTNPALIQLSIVWLILNKYAFKIRFSQLEDCSRTRMALASLLLLSAIIIFGGFFSQLMPQLHLADSLEYGSIETLPETKDNIRLMPYEVAYRYGKDALQLSQYRLGTENIAFIDGKLSWMFPLVPSAELIKFTLKNKGIVHVDATTQEKTNIMVWKDLNIGEEMQIFDNLHWNLYNKKYFVGLDDPYYIPLNGEIYTVVPATGYEFNHFFGILYTVPKFEGVFLADSSGNIDFLSPEQAREHGALKGNRLFPETLSRYYIESYAFHKGIINKFLIHEDQIEIRDIDYNNRQPFLMDTVDGLKWFISTEPFGESRGVFKIFLVDAVTGKIEKHELDPEETLTGPAKATDFVRRANPIVDWTRFKIVEPLPFITDSILYWKVVVIPVDAAGIAYQAFVNSKTNDVLEFSSDGQIRDFILKGTPPKAEPQQKETKENAVKQIKEKLKEVDALLEFLGNS